MVQADDLFHEVGHGAFDTTNSSTFEQSSTIIVCDGSDVFKFTVYIYYLADETDLRPLADDYDRFLENEKLRDVVFVLGNEEILAHKQIISARSEVFAKMFDLDMAEKKDGRVEISDIEPNIFKLFLRFVYCGKLETKNTDDLLKVIVAADKYSVKSLVTICGHRLIDNLSIDNAVYILIIADLVKVDFLKSKCIELIVKNKNVVSETDEFKQMVKSGRADLLCELFLSEV